jgi:ABC-2 type transport system permease protein
VNEIANAAPRPLYWSVRRELWENRSIVIAPLMAAGVMLFTYFFTLVHLKQSLGGFSDLDARQQAMDLAMPYSHAGMLLLATALIVGLVYSLDALHGERRDRSILFWKSLPVSDLTTVLAKALIPLLILPGIVLALTLGLQVILLLLSTLVLLVGGTGVGVLWGHLPLLQMTLELFYELLVITLWFAPIYGWLMLVSGWAKRSAFLWAVLPVLALCVTERIAFGSTWGFSLLKDRLIGFATLAFQWVTPQGTFVDPHLIPLSQLTPGRFFGAPGLWVGLVCAVAFFAAAIRLRRYREPI